MIKHFTTENTELVVDYICNVSYLPIRNIIHKIRDISKSNNYFIKTYFMIHIVGLRAHNFIIMFFSFLYK